MWYLFKRIYISVEGNFHYLLFFYIYSTHMQDLQEVTQEVHYENYRSERLAKGAPVPPRRQT